MAISVLPTRAVSLAVDELRRRLREVSWSVQIGAKDPSCTADSLDCQLAERLPVPQPIRVDPQDLAHAAGRVRGLRRRNCWPATDRHDGGRRRAVRSGRAVGTVDRLPRLNAGRPRRPSCIAYWPRRPTRCRVPQRPTPGPRTTTATGSRLLDPTSL